MGVDGVLLLEGGEGGVRRRDASIRKKSGRRLWWMKRKKGKEKIKMTPGIGYDLISMLLVQGLLCEP